MTNQTSFDVLNPSTGELISTIDSDSQILAISKLDHAYSLFRDSARQLPLHVRIDMLEKLIPLMESNRYGFIQTMVQEGGKPWQDSVIEFNRALMGIRIAINTVSEHNGSKIPLGYQASSTDRIAMTHVFPRGVVLAFSAFNHPLNLIIHQVIPAFITGCPCIIKPAPDTPLSCIMLVDAMHQVGIPIDYIQTVLTQDLDIAATLAESEKIAFFSFIGSAKIGWMLRSKLKPGVRCALEHGGVAPCIVSESANLDSAVAAITKGGFYHAGQVCVSTQRVFINQQIIDDFVDKLSNKASQLTVGNASDHAVDIGPLIRPGEVDRVESWVNEAIEQGAKCIIGGKRLDGNFYSPTILLNPPASAKVSQEEVFGPVLCVYSYDSFDEALQLANSETYAFQSAIFSQNLQEIHKAFEVLDASAIMINDHTAFRDDAMPFAGLKQSGLGVGGIPYSIKEMQYEKMLVLKK